VAGGEIGYRCLGTNRVEVTVGLFSDCGATGQQVYTSLDVNFSSGSCGWLGVTTLPLINGGGVEVSTGPYPVCGASSCQGGSAYGIRKYIYQGVLQLQGVCTDWVVSCELVNRNTVVTTLVNPQDYSLHLEAGFDNLHFPDDSSTVFANPGVLLSCVHDGLYYDPLLTDASADSVRAALIPPQGIPGPGQSLTNIPYATGYSPALPFQTTSGFFFDPISGTCSGQPALIEGASIACRFVRYRNGMPAGFVVREVQVLIAATCNRPASLSSATLAPLQCGDTVFTLQLSTPIRCSTLSPDGTDFRLFGPNGQLLPITGATPLACNNNLLTVLELRLFQPLVENGIYRLWCKTGSDGNTLLNACGDALPEGDTLFITFTDCYFGIPDLRNVSVSDDEDGWTVLWEPPAGMDVRQFSAYTLYRSDNVGSPFLPIATITDPGDTTYHDQDPRADRQAVRYAVDLLTNTGFRSSRSDSLQTIFLTCVEEADSLHLLLSWTPYGGWPATYEVVQFDSSGVPFTVAGSATTATTYRYEKPDYNGEYRLRIRTGNGGQPMLMSWSNSCRFEVHNTSVVVSTVMTPNGDGKNDRFFIRNLELYPGTRLRVFDRWGTIVYESDDYRNDWDGGNLRGDTYFYILHVADSRSTEKRGTLTVLR
jgi:gliding motility-associated-like protein